MWRCIINILRVTNSNGSRVVQSVQLLVSSSVAILYKCRVSSRAVCPNQPPIHRLPIALSSEVKRQESGAKQLPPSKATNKGAWTAPPNLPRILILGFKPLQHTGYSLYCIACIITEFLHTHLHTPSLSPFFRIILKVRIYYFSISINQVVFVIEILCVFCEV